MEQATGKKVLIVYQHKSTGKHTVTGAVTKTAYGYRKRGDRFEVYEADMKVRPDLYRPVNAKPKPDRVVALRSARARAEEKVRMQRRKAQTTAPPGMPAPEPPPPPKHINPREDMIQEPEMTEVPLSGFDWAGTRVNKGHLAKLSKAGIHKLSDLDETNEAMLLKITGIGPSTVRALYNMQRKYAG